MVDGFVVVMGSVLLDDNKALWNKMTMWSFKDLDYIADLTFQLWIVKPEITLLESLNSLIKSINFFVCNLNNKHRSYNCPSVSWWCISKVYSELGWWDGVPLDLLVMANFVHSMQGASLLVDLGLWCLLQAYNQASDPATCLHLLFVRATECVHMQAIVSYTIFQSIQCADDASCSSCSHQISLWSCLSATKMLSTWACTHDYNNAHCTHRDFQQRGSILHQN
jgi:hypothetical protein